MIEIQVDQIIQPFLTISVRLTGLMLFAPFFGSSAIPARIKACIVIALSVLLYPLLAPGMRAVPPQRWPELIVTELAVGSALGIVANLVFDAVQTAGQMLSMQMGLSLASMMDPQTQSDSTALGVFHQTLTMLIFLALNVHLRLLDLIARSFRLLPPGSAHISEAFTLQALRAGGQVFALGLQLAAPVFSATLIADVVLGLLGRTSPQMPVMLLGPALKSLLGLAVLYSALRYWPSLLDRFFQQTIAVSNNLLGFAQ